MDDDGDRVLVVVTDVRLPFAAVLDIVFKIVLAAVVIAVPFVVIGAVAAFVLAF